MAKEIVIPGEELGIEEEFFGNEKTYAENGNVYSLVLGEKKLVDRQVQVHTRKFARMLRKGDVVIGKVHDLYDSVSLIIIENPDNYRGFESASPNSGGFGMANGNKPKGTDDGESVPAIASSQGADTKKPIERKSIGATYAYMRITELVRGGGYVKNFRQHIKIGDILKARVIEVNPLGTYLSIADDSLGVLKARCSTCHIDLEQRGRILVCPECGGKESRKLA